MSNLFRMIIGNFIRSFISSIQILSLGVRYTSYKDRSAFTLLFWRLILVKKAEKCKPSNEQA